MKSYRLTLVFGLVLILAGCNSSKQVAQNEKPRSLQLGDKTEYSLKELLSKPREELAALAEECRTKIDFQDRALRDGGLHFNLLPGIRLPLVVPVWHEAKYSSKRAFSLPSYAALDAQDSALALHLARYGDAEAAEKLVEPDDAPALRAILADASERSYPAEWTRFVGLLLHAAEIRTAVGEVDGPTELVLLHRELREMLDTRAAKGALGAALLSPGYDLLKLAAATWRTQKQTGLADQIDQALKEWGNCPTRDVNPLLGRPRKEIARVLKDAGQGRAIVVAPPDRAVDLLELPLPCEGAEAYVAFFDNRDCLSEAWITYGESARGRFPQPAHLAYRISPDPSATTSGAETSGSPSHAFKAAGFEYDMLFPSPGSGVGAIVRIATDKKPLFNIPLPRDFGDLHLDRTFEQNRLRLRPDRRSDILTLSDSKALARIIHPISQPKPDQATFRKAPGHDLLAGISVRYPLGAEGAPPLHQILATLWQNAGVAEVHERYDDDNMYLAFEWHDPQTRYALRLPFTSPAPIIFEATDARQPAEDGERQAAAAAFDRKERAERFRSGKLFTHLGRSLERFELGMPRAQAEQLIPAGKSVVRHDIPGGFAITLFRRPGESEAYVLRRISVRFGKGDKVAELRCRYGDGDPSVANSDWSTEILNPLKKQAGAPLGLAPSWSKFFADSPAQKPDPVCLSWQDDTTALTYQRDAGGVEVILRDCPVDDEDGAPLPPLEYLPQGSGECLLGASRAELLHKWNIEKPVVVGDGALVLTPAEPRAYDALLVWFENDRVSHIVARHEPGNTKPTNPTEWGEAVTLAWRRELGLLGWPCRFDLLKSGALQSLAWRDERTRIRIFWQESDDGAIRLYTEWNDFCGK
jgi:hypothetical protein